MRPLIALSQRVVVDRSGERRDALDQRWHKICAAAGFSALPLPNDLETACDLFQQCAPSGLILTGGNDIGVLGGDAPERDATEAALLDTAAALGVPVLGVCRGAEFIVHAHGGTIARTQGHAGTRHGISMDGATFEIGSYHDWGIAALPAGYRAWAHADDGSIEAFRSPSGKVAGLMWHPERESPTRVFDVEMLKGFFA